MLERALAVTLLKSADGVENILNVESEVDHARMRRVVAHGFSEKALREQESLILEYVDLFIRSLHEAAEEGPQNMVSWYEFVTFDIIGMRESSLIEGS